MKSVKFSKITLYGKKLDISQRFVPYKRVKRNKNKVLITTINNLKQGAKEANLPQIEKGVYIIRKNGSTIPAYIGHSDTQLFKTITRHFQKWTDKQHRATFDKKGYNVQVILVNGNKSAMPLEQLLIFGFSEKLKKNILKPTGEEFREFSGNLEGKLKVIYGKFASENPKELTEAEKELEKIQAEIRAAADAHYGDITNIPDLEEDENVPF